MHVGFDLLIPKFCIDGGFAFKEVFIVWGEQSFSQDPPLFTWDNEINFREQTMPEYMLGYLTAQLDISDWVYLSLDCDAIESWEKSINDSSFDDIQPPLKKMLNELLSSLSEWVVIFELNCDQIDSVYQMDNVALINKIEATLHWHNEPEGFVAWQKL